MSKNYILLIVGKSGSGKSTLCKYMEDEYGLKEVKSFTTRPQRKRDDTSHVFVSDGVFDTFDDLCAYTVFDGYKYGARISQVDECDMYVIDVQGLEYFLKTYTGKKIPMPIYIYSSTPVRKDRMRERGDSDEKIMGRLEHDIKAFENINDYAMRTYINDDMSMKDIKYIAKDLYDDFFREKE